MRLVVSRRGRTALVCAVLLVGATAITTAATKQPWRAAFDPDGVSADPSPPFEATEAVLLLESFDDVTFPPAGWGQFYVAGAFDWDRQTAGTNPSITPHSGAGMARWNCYSIAAGNATRLESPAVDLTAAASPSLHFWMSHDTGYSSNDDRVEVEVSTDGGGSWTPLGTVSRYDAACGTPCWQEHVFDLSAYMGQPAVMVGLLGVSEYGNNIFLDDVTIQEPAPNLSTSSKSAPGATIQGDEITYTIEIINTGGGPAGAATLVDPIPTDTAYVVGSVSCTSGACGYNGTFDQIEWSGSVAAAATVTVTFAVDTDTVPCDSYVTNTAEINDPELIGGPVTVQASTRVAYTLAAVDESFTDTTFPPVGWTEEILVDPGTDPDWSRVTTGTSPTIAPHTPPAMTKFNSYNTQATGSARLSTYSFDLTGFTMPTLSFWMSHDTGYASNADLIQPQVSTDAGLSWTDVGAPFLRYDAACTTACWQQHLVDLGAYIGQTDVRIALVAVSAYGNNMYVDDVVVAEPWYPCPSVSVDPDYIGGGCQGDMLDYPLTVTNLYSATDTLDLTFMNAWPMAVDPTSFTLAPIESAVANVSVAVPWGPGPGDFDVASFLVTGQLSGLTDTAEIRTFVNVAGTYADFANVPDDPAGLRTRDHSVVYFEGKLYKFGGYDGSARDLTAVYDFFTDTWSMADPMPGPRYWLDCVEIGGKIYCGGGYSTSGQTTMYIFDPAAPPGSQWTSGASLPAYRYGYAGVALNGKYYLLGGYAAGYTATCIVYDPVSDTWDSIPDMEVARRYPLAGVIGGKIIVTGGLVSSSASTPSTQAYDPISNTWSPRAPNPYGGWVRTADGVLHDRFLIITGGYSADATASNYVLAYDALADVWDVPQATMPHLIYGAEGDTDGAGNFWYVSGRVYEGGVFSYSPYTVQVTGCPPPTADLSIVKDDGVTQVVPGDPVTYTITVSNLGPAPAPESHVIDNFPAELLNVTWTCTATGGGFCSPAGVGNINELVGIGPGDTITFVAEGTVDPNAEGVLIEGRQSLANTTTVFPPPSTPDPDLSNNSSSDIDDIVFLADAEITMDDGVTEVRPGDEVTYTITVTNLGPSGTNGAIVTDVFPSEILNVTWTCVGSGGGLCTAAGSGALVDVAVLPTGGAVTYTAIGTVGPDAEGTIDNTANVAVTDATDPDLTNNSATDSDTVIEEELPFADGFESGDTSAWSATVP